MQNLILNDTRTLLGLKPIATSWQTLQKAGFSYYHEHNILQKVIYTDEKKGIKVYTELDTDIKLDNALDIISSRGKGKPLNLRNIEKEKSKASSLSINLNQKTLLVNCGVKWLPELSFSAVETLDADVQAQIESLYGEKQWKAKVEQLLKNPKIRQSYKDGDVICIRLDAGKYVYALLIGSFMKLRKKDFWPSRQTGHFFSSLMCVPIVLRKFNFVTNKNDLGLDDILKHELLNPEIIMDDLLLRGSFKIVAHKKLVEDDILFPMHYSCYGKHSGSGQATAFGMGVFDKENRKNVKAWLKSRLPHYKEITIVFNWGFGAVELDANHFVNNAESDDNFEDRNGLGGMVDGLDGKGKLINAYNTFSKEKLQRIFKTMGIDCEPDFDAFNKKYGGLTRQEYLNNI